MEVCLQDANFNLGGMVPALFCPFTVSSTYSSNVSISVFMSRLGFGLVDIILNRVYIVRRMLYLRGFRLFNIVKVGLWG